MTIISNVQVIIEKNNATAEQQDFFQMSDRSDDENKITLSLNGKKISSVDKTRRPSKHVLTHAVQAIGLDREFFLESVVDNATTGYYATKQFVGETRLGPSGSIGREIMISLAKRDCKEKMIDNFDEREDSDLFSTLYQLFLCRLSLAAAEEDPKLLVSVFIKSIAPTPLSNGRLMRLETRKQQMRVIHAKTKVAKALNQGVELSFEEALASARYRGTDVLTESVSKVEDIEVELDESEEIADIYLSDIDDDLAKTISLDTEDFVNSFEADGLFDDFSHDNFDIENLSY
jgi:hypothetical protein